MLAAIFFFPTFFFGPLFLAAFTPALNGEARRLSPPTEMRSTSPLPDRNKQRGAGAPGKRSPGGRAARHDVAAREPQCVLVGALTLQAGAPRSSERRW